MIRWPERQEPRQAGSGQAGSGQAASRQSGFTLLEVLVAVAIFAVMSTLAYRGLSDTLISDQAMASASTELRELQFALSLLERDLRAALPRKWRDEDGRSRSPLVSHTAAIDLVRGGWSNPIGQTRAELEAVRYQRDGDTFQRLRWSALDRSRSSRPQVDVLLNDITQARFEFLDRAGSWSSAWPRASRQSGRPTRPLATPESSQPGSVLATGDAAAATAAWPRAVRVQLQSRRWGQIERVIMLVDQTTIGSGPVAPAPSDNATGAEQ